MKLGSNLGVSHDSSRACAAVALPSIHHPISYNSEAHVTLVFAGEVEQADVTGLRRTMKDLARNGAPFTAKIIGQEMFGDNNDEPVLLVDHPEFKAMRRFLEEHNASQWPFRPHIAVPTHDGMHRMPQDIAFDRLGLWAGDDHQHWWLGSGNPTSL